MEIGPIPGIRAVAVVRSRPDETALIADFEIDQAARPDEDTYSSGNGEADGAEEPDADSEELIDSADEEITGSAHDIHEYPGNIDIVI